MLDQRSITLRLARPADAPVVRRLADLDSAPALHEPVMLAILDREPVAALSLRDGRAAADPFRPTASAVALLRERAAAFHGPARRRTRKPLRLRPRAAV